MADAQSMPKTVRLADYRPPDWLVPEVELRLELDEQRTRVTSRLLVERNGEGEAPLTLDCEELTLVSLSVDGRPLERSEYSLSSERLVIGLPARRAVVETVVEVEPARNTQLMGLYASGGNLCTQCEAEGFRRITFFPDRPDVLSRYRVRLEADRERYPVLLANGNLVEEGALDGGRHYAVWEDPFPKPCYLFAVVAGQLGVYRDSFTTMSGRTVQLGIWAKEQDLPRCAHAMASLKQAMRWDEENYGREYDLDLFNIVAISDFNFGAMENKGLNIFNSKYILADPETATDADFDAVAAVVAHEYFHNWTGNRITCRDWFQLSLKEGLTVYRDQQFSADQGSAAVKRIEDVRALRAAQFQEDAGPLAHPVRPDSYIEISNFYTSTVYNKGAEVIRMLATLLGRERFRRGLDLYFERFDGKAVTVEDFLQVIEEAGEVDLGQFRLWYSQSGTPHVRATLAHDPAARTATVTLEQMVPPTPGQPVKRPMHIPIRMALFGRRSEARLGEERLVELREQRMEVRFEGVGEPPAMSLLRGFSAPVIVEADSSADVLAFLSAHDDDPFARYEAMQRLAVDLLVREVESGERQDVGPLVAAIGRTLEADELDPAFVAEAVVLPSESFIGDRMQRIDPDSIHRTRERVRLVLKEALESLWWHVYRSNQANRYEMSPEAKGRRRLKNVALAYLMAGDDPRAVEAATGQYDRADNMTDRMAAISLLASSESEAREAALDDFYARFRHDPLVVDKWFSLQATAARRDTLQSVIRLAEHPDFSVTNPNRCRALVAAFAVNQRCFHDPSGEGYRFLADQVLRIDALNPQVAARLVAPLGRWRRFDERRGTLMRRELDRILSTPGLSKDVFEMASKSLG